MPSRSDPIQLWYYSSGLAVLPDGLAADRFPWTALGGGGALSPLGVTITASAAQVAYEGLAARTLIPDRIDLQIRFQGVTSSPQWASGVSGHVAWIDDGQRVLGVAIGDALDVVDPVTGTRLYTVPSEDLPGGWTLARDYLFVKDGTATWELLVDGRPVFTLPYGIGVPSSRSVGALGFGWQDATALAHGVASWDEIEVGINAVVAPRWIVDRARETVTPYLRERWTQRNEALLRATVGIAYATRDQMARARDEFTAAVLPVVDAAFSGAELPTISGWTGVGSGTVSIVRERVRIEGSTAPTFVRWDFPTIDNADAVYYAAGRFTLREGTFEDARGRMGPFVSIRDGNRQISAILRATPGNPQDVGWILSDGDFSSAIENTGRVSLRAAFDGESFVELYVIGRTRVVLFVNGALSEDVRYDTFSEPATEFDVRLGRDGSADLSATVDLSDGVARVLLGDRAQRALFLRRVAERLLFAGGLERNDQLDAWMRHRAGVFAARGTDRVLSEVQRISCDDAAEFVVNRQPGDWYLDVTHPEVSPTFLEGVGDVPVVYVEHRALAPNFTPTELGDLIEQYLIPTSAVQSRFYASLVTDLVTDAVTTDASTFEVASALGFAVGDLVTLRSVETGTLLSLDYDAADPLAADTMDVSSHLGDVWAIWTATRAGEAADEIGGGLQLTGLLGDRLGLVNSGDHVQVTSDDPDEDTWVEIFGVAIGPTITSERLHIVGTTPVIGTLVWGEVHGVTARTPAIGNLAFDDAEAVSPLYALAPGEQASGAYLFDPPLFAEPARISAVADAATVAVFLVAGAERDATDTVISQALNGTTPVSPATVWASIRAIPMGYVAAARTVTITGAVLADPGASLSIVSTSASDTQTVTVYLITTDLEPEVLTGTLAGTTPVVLTPVGTPFHVLGVELSAPAVGTVRLTFAGTPSILVTQFAPAAQRKGVSRRRVAAVGGIEARLSGTVTTARWVLVSGLDADGLPASEVLALDSTAWIAGLEDWSEIRAIAVGNVPTTRNVQIRGRAWRYPYETHALTQIPDLYGWSASGPAETTLDGVLDPLISADATAGTLNLTGSWSRTEDATITDLVGPIITTTALDGSFLAGSRMRLAP